MALLTKKEFRELCQVKSDSMRVYVQRGKIILSGDYIDDSIPQNQDFLKKRLDKLKRDLEVFKEDEQEEPESEKAKITPIPKIKPPILPKIDPPNVAAPELFDENLSGYELEKRKKALDIEKITEEISLLQIRKEKQQGIVIPTELVKMIFAQHSKSIVSSFHNAADSFLIQIGKKKSLTREEMALFRGKLVDVINVAVEDSITESKAAIKNLIAEYAEKRGVGERK